MQAFARASVPVVGTYTSQPRPPTGVGFFRGCFLSIRRAAQHVVHARFVMLRIACAAQPAPL